MFGWYFMAGKIPGWIERLLLPRLSSIEGELKAVNSEMKRLETKIDSLDERLNTRIDSLSEKVDVVRDIERLKVEGAELKRQR
jgi:peptidoglycan hydrolase CwlO-like protein